MSHSALRASLQLSAISCTFIAARKDSEVYEYKWEGIYSSVCILEVITSLKCTGSRRISGRRRPASEAR
jgi:hypothetical protein